MGLQLFRGFVWRRLFKPVLSFLGYCLRHPIKTVLFTLKLFLIFVLFSIVSTVFIFSYAADDYVLAPVRIVGQFYSIPNSAATPPYVRSSSVGGACTEKGGTMRGNFCFIGSKGFSYLEGPFNCANYPNDADVKKVCSPDYYCPPEKSPDYSVGPMDLNGQKVCYRRSCSSKQNWFDSSMALGTGSACSFGCQYTVTASYQSSTGNNAFIANGSGQTCTCPNNATRCWQSFAPNTDPDNDTSGTCYAWDMGEVKGVDCGKNGEMTVDLQPINESLNAMSKKNQDQDAAIKQNTDWIFDNTADIQNLKVDVSKLKEMGCSVSQGSNGVTINCNGTTATALNGAKGEKGDKGEQGPSGGNGPKGDAGEKGEKGDKGDPGAQGQQGEKGEKGDKGDAGEQGKQGDKGDKGEQGLQGVAGLNGTNGRDGQDGAKGEQGEKGEDGDSVVAVQNGDDVDLISASTGARMATLKGIDKDGIIQAIEQGNTTLDQILQTMKNASSSAAPSTDFNVDYGDKLGAKQDWDTHNFTSVMNDFVGKMKQTEVFASVGKYFSVSFSGACSPIQFNFSLFDRSFNLTADPFCGFEYWEYIKAVVMMVFGFFAFRVAIDN